MLHFAPKRVGVGRYLAMPNITHIFFRNVFLNPRPAGPSGAGTEGASGG